MERLTHCIMKRLLVIFSILFYCTPLHAQDFDTKKMRYIEQYKYWAMDEQIRTGVPAAISIAQGILETGSGTSELSVKANNHFGIKCKKEWTGETYLHDDDRRRECFRKYKSAKDSYIDHSNFLKERAHYGSLFDLDVTDYQAWSKGLKKAGYATNPKYATRLIQLIEKYNLQEYTYEAIDLSKEEVVAEVVPEKDKAIDVVQQNEVIESAPIVPVNNTPVPKAKIVFDKQMVKNGKPGFWARKGDYLLPEAVQYNMRYAKLLAINDLEDAPLKDDMFIYLKRKAKKGDREFHKVANGESMHSISQKTGVQLKYLYIYNNLYDSEEPAVGERIYLRQRSSKTPKLNGQVAQSNAPAAKVEIIQPIKRTVRAEKKVAPTKVITAKKKIELKKNNIAEKKKEVPQLKKKDAIVGAKKMADPEVVKTSISKKEIEQDERIILKKDKVKVTEYRPVAQKASLVTKQAVGSPVLNLEKAKKVEQLMGDGKKEIEKIYFKNQQAIKAKRVVAAPLSNNTESNNKELIKEKAKKTAVKKIAVKKTADKKVEKKNNNKVSNDVKNLKKKFDNLIYDED